MSKAERSSGWVLLSPVRIASSSFILYSSGCIGVGEMDEGVCGRVGVAGGGGEEESLFSVGGVGIAHATNAHGFRLVSRRPLCDLSLLFSTPFFIPPLLHFILLSRMCVCKATR